MNNTKSTRIRQIEESIAQAQKDLATLKAEVEKEEQPISDNIYGLVLPEPDDKVYTIKQSPLEGKFKKDYFYASGNEPYPVFAEENQAVKWANAMNTLFKLMTSEGVIIPKDKNFWIINGFNRGTGNIEYDVWFPTANYTTTYLSPSFNTESDALNAVKAVGEENVIAMFKTFKGM